MTDVAVTLLPAPRAGGPRSAPPAPRPTVRAAGPEDHAGLLRLLALCSSQTLYHRFFTGWGGEPPRRLVDRLLARDAATRAVLALVGDEVVGHGCCGLVPGERDATVDVALLVRDDHQGRGVGTALLHALRQEAGELGAERIAATTLADNRAAAALLRAHGFTGPARREGAALTYHVSRERLGRR